MGLTVTVPELATTVAVANQSPVPVSTGLDSEVNVMLRVGVKTMIARSDEALQEVIDDRLTVVPCGPETGFM